MDGQYTELIEAASELLSSGLLKDAEPLIEEGKRLDRFVLDLMRDRGD